MSYHILQQFDEQWLTELRETPLGDQRCSLLESLEDDSTHALRARLASRESKRWAIVVASILLATFALFFSIEATRRAETLQQRLDALEKTAKK